MSGPYMHIQSKKHAQMSDKHASTTQGERGTPMSLFHVKELIILTRIPIPFQRKGDMAQAFAVSLFLKEAIDAK